MYGCWKALAGMREGLGGDECRQCETKITHPTTPAEARSRADRRGRDHPGNAYHTGWGLSEETLALLLSDGRTDGGANSDATVYC